MMSDSQVQFTIIDRQWYKRRQPSAQQVQPVSVVIPDYQAIHNHFCTMVVSYSDGSEKSLIARVIYNQLNEQWTVDGMEVAVLVEDE